MIENISPSRAAQFKLCPQQFKFANIDKIEQPATDATAKGTTIHEALEKLYDFPKEERTLDNLVSLFREEWTKTRTDEEYSHLFKTIEEEREWGLDALDLLFNYFNLEDPTEIEPIGREKYLEDNIEDMRMRGILDRMDRNENGDLVIVDYKSGKAPAERYKESRFFALKIYALLIYQELGEMPKELKLIYLRNSKIHTIPFDEEVLEDIRNEILNIWEDIKVAFKTNQFPTQTNPLCDWCSFKSICPAFLDW